MKKFDDIDDVEVIEFEEIEEVELVKEVDDKILDVMYLVLFLGGMFIIMGNIDSYICMVN